MKKIAKGIVKIRYFLTVLFFILVGVCGFLSTKVNINYDMFKYLDQSSESTVALNKMIEDFGAAGSASVMVKHVSTEEANQIKVTIEGIDGVNSVIFDASNESCYKDSYALYTIYLETGDFEQASYDTMDNIREALSSYDIAATGATVVSQYLVEAADRDMVKILSIACAVVFVILIITSSSWVEPLMFAIIVAGAIVMNLGTNVFMSEISFVTKSIAAVMQLALAMDYSIILLHSYNEEKEKGISNVEAMENALASSFKPISSSSITTIAGLVALMFMSFSIGFDVGLVLAKGILLSLLTVFLFMPGILLIFSPLIDKTKHRNLFEVARDHRDNRPNVKHSFTNFQYKTRILIPVIILLLVIAGCALNFNSKYDYELEASSDPKASINVEKNEIQNEFGIQNVVVVLLPKADVAEQFKILNYMNNYQYKGEYVINGSQGMVTTGLYSSFSSDEIAQKFGLPKELVDSVFEKITPDENGKVLLYDLLAYLKSDAGQTFIANYIQGLQNSINEKADSYNTYFIALDAEHMAAALNMDASLVSSLYEMMHVETTTVYDLAQFIKANNAIVTIGQSLQEDTNTKADTYNQYFVELDSTHMALALSIDASMVDSLYQMMGVESCSTYDLVQFIKNNDACTKLGSSMQQSINEKAESVAPLFDDTNRAQAEAFIVAYESSEEMQQNEEYTAKYKAYKEALTTLTKEQVLASYSFLSSELVDTMFASYDKTETIYVYELVTFLSNNNVLTQVGSTMQSTVNTKADQLLPLGSALNKEQLISALGLTDGLADLVLGEETTIKGINALNKIKNQSLINAYSAAMQKSVNDKATQLQALGTELNKEQLISGLGLTSSLADLVLGENETIKGIDALNKIKNESLILGFGSTLTNTLNETWATVEYALSMFETDTEARMLFNLNMSISSNDSFKAIKEIKDGIKEIDSESQIVCTSYVYSDIKDVFNSDMVVVNLISFFAILIIIAFTFKSWFVPVLLTVLIQGAIWITMGISTVCGKSIFFVCYLVVMCIQMGATVDYAILLTTKYMENRKTMNKKDSIRLALESSLMTILTSGTILIVSAFIIGLVSDISIISSLGLLLSRGCLISVLIILFALPQILMLCDPLLTKSTLHTTFIKDDSRMINLKKESK